MAEGVGNAPTSGLTGSCFQDRRSQLISACLPQKLRVDGLWLIEHGFRLSTFNHPLSTKTGCQGWTRTNTVRFNKPSCYFDTTWQLRLGAAGRILTCIVPLRRRMPDVFDHGSGLVDS